MIGDDGAVDTRFQHRPDRPERTVRSHWDGLRILATVGVAVFVVCLLLVLAGCGGNGHKGEHCVRSHTDTIWVQHCAAYGKYGCTVWVPQLIQEKHCDEWAPDDPATVVKP